MGFQRYDGFVILNAPTYSSLGGVNVYVCAQPSNCNQANPVSTPVPPSPLATLYADSMGVTPLVNPVVTDPNGHFFFYIVSPITVDLFVQDPFGRLTSPQVYLDQTIGAGGAVGVTALNLLTGVVTLVAGTGISITPSGQNITITNTNGSTVGGTIAVNQVAVGSGVNTIGGSSNFTYNPSTKVLSINGITGPAISIDSAQDVALLGGYAALTVFSGNNIGPIAGNYSLSMDPGATGGLLIGHNLVSGPLLNWDAQTGYLYLRNTSGRAAIGVASAAGSPAVILLPTTTGAAGQALVTDGNTPQQTSWTTIAGVSGGITAGQIAVGNGANTIGGSSAFTLTGGVLTLNDNWNFTGPNGQFFQTGINGGHNFVELSSGVFNCDIVLDQVTGINLEISTGQTISLGSINGVWVFDGVTGYLQAHGLTSGFAALGVAAIAGTPNPILLPKTTAVAAGEMLLSDGNNPQQTSWSTGLTWTPEGGSPPVGGTLLLSNPLLATSPSNEPAAPSLALQGAYWTGSVSAHDIFSLDVTMQGNAVPSQASAVLTLNHVGSNIAYLTLGPQIFRFTSSGENVLGSVSVGNLFVQSEQSNGIVFNLSAAANAVGNVTTYTGVISVIIPTAGQYVTIAGFTNPGNNGRFIVKTGAINTVTVYNPNGVTESNPATLTFDSALASNGTIFSEGFGQGTGFKINGVSYNVTMGSQAEPLAVPFVITMASNATDAGYLRIVNDGATGNHGMEIGAVVGGSAGSPPVEANAVTLSLGYFGGAEKAVFSSTINIPSNPPATSSSPGTAGDLTWDANFIYQCIATNSWKRNPISTW